MSLTQYIKSHKPLRSAFKHLLKHESLKMDPTPLLAQPLTKKNDFVGTAFDYLLRIALGKKFLDADFPVYKKPWIAEQICDDRLDLIISDEAVKKKWRNIISDAREEIETTEINTGTLPRIVKLVQYLAHADYLMRYPREFDPGFKPASDVAANLMALHKVFVSAKGFEAKEICILNPDFASSLEVGGADADLVLDSTLIDFKTVSEINKRTTDYVMQLAGYAVLHGRGGIELEEPPSYQKPFTHFGIYFSRHGQLVTWSIDDIFQPGGFDEFSKIFWEELPRWK